MSVFHNVPGVPHEKVERYISRNYQIGKIPGISDLASFEGPSAKELKKPFK
jgi:hypothetical protein